MQNFVYAKESGTVSLTTGSAVDLLTLDLPGSIHNPQDWLIIATAEVGGFPDANVAHITYTRSDFVVGSTTIGQFTGKFQGIGTGLFVNSPWHRVMYTHYLKDFTGGSSSTTAIACKFVGQNLSTTPGTDKSRFKNMSIIAVRIPKSIKSGCHYFSESGAPLVNLSTTTQLFGSFTFTPSKGKYLILGTAQLDFTVATADTADCWLDIYQTEDASTENGGTNLLLSTIPEEHVASTGVGHFTFYGDATTNALKYPITVLDIVDFKNEPATLTWKADSSGTDGDILSSSIIAIPLDNSFIVNHAQSKLPRSNSTSTYDTAIENFDLGVSGKKSFIIANAYTYPYSGIEYIVSHASATTFGEFITETLTSNNGASECSQVCGMQMLTGVDTIKIEHKQNVTALGTGDSYIKNAILLGFVDMQSNQDIEVDFDIEFSQDVEYAERRSIIDEPTAKSIEGLTEDGSPVHANTRSNIRDQNPGMVNVAPSDSGFYYKTTDYTRDG